MDTHQTQIASPDRALPIADHAGLRACLLEAHLPTLLMVYVQLTQDLVLLDSMAPYLRPPYSTDPVEMPAPLAATLRQRLFAVLTQTPPPEPTKLPEAMIRHMMNVNVCETVADEFLPMLMEQMGFELPTPRLAVAGRAAPPPGFKVLVIGAGMTGIVASIKLREAGYDHVIIEKNPEVGGTWYENRYPGVGVDTPSYFYSFSFEINPHWNHYHPKGHDMQDYLLNVARKYDVHRFTRFNTKVVACHYDDASSIWRVTVKPSNGPEEVIEANAVINAHGPLNRWKLPAIPGLDSFAGPAMHTATWDSKVELRGKNVVMIGTGASGVQLAAAIAPLAAHLTIIQRSRHWVLRNPEVGVPVTDGVKFAMRHIPHYKEWFRFRVFWFAGDGLFVNVLRDPTWPNQEVSVSAANDAMRQYALYHLTTTLRDRPDLLEKTLPDHPIFSKRLLMDDGWFVTLKRDNVTLLTDPIDHIEPHQVVMRDGSAHPADVLALATGFEVAKMLGSLEVTGRDGRSLNAEWGEEDPRAYLGVTVPGYPNFFLTVGPNSAPNHAAGQNLVSEAQVNYIIECLDAMLAHGARGIEPKHTAYLAFNEKIEARMQDMIWSHPKANSYYNNSQHRNFMSWPYRLVEYWHAMRAPAPGDFTFR